MSTFKAVSEKNIRAYDIYESLLNLQTRQLDENNFVFDLNLFAQSGYHVDATVGGAQSGAAANDRVSFDKMFGYEFSRKNFMRSDQYQSLKMVCV